MKVSSLIENVIDFENQPYNLHNPTIKISLSIRKLISQIQTINAQLGAGKIPPNSYAQIKQQRNDLVSKVQKLKHEKSQIQQQQNTNNGQIKDTKTRWAIE